MAFSIEMMAEAAAVLVPAKLVVGLEHVRLHRWIPFDEDPITLEVTARLASAEPASGGREPPGDPAPHPTATSRVRVEIRDLGNASRPGNPRAAVVEGVVVLGECYPEPPAAGDFVLTHEGPCRYTADQLYEAERRLFHGPLFQAVCTTDRQGAEGIEGHLRTLPHSGLFRSTPAPDLLTDPILIDASTHILGCWHLSLPDQSGRVVFPYEIGAVDLFSPRPLVGTRVKCRVRIERSSARQVSHRIELLGPDDRLWCCLAPAEYWRFYWPPVYGEFFRRQNEYVLSQDWPAAGARCMRIDPPDDMRQPVWRAALARVSLSPAEWQRFRALTGPDQRRTDWLFGRIAAKDALRTLWRERHGERLFPADIEIDADEFGRPVPRRRAAPEAALPAVSIAHAGGVAVALAAFDRRVGIDLERVQPRGEGFEALAFDEAERELLRAFGPDRDEAVARLWCAKEAVAKALGRGLVEGPRSLAVRAVDPGTGTARVTLGPLLAAALPEWQGALLVARTARDGDYVVATTFCERTPE
jgi:phosphopantetheinyl transferase